MRIEDGVGTSLTGLILIEWTREFADFAGVKHICGLDCVVKIVMKSISAGA
jgi:hypothetical protein